MECPVTLLCRNQGDTPEKRMEQALMCANIEGYTNAISEMNKFITSLYRKKDPLASIIYNTLKPLIEMQNTNYNYLVDELNK